MKLTNTILLTILAVTITAAPIVAREEVRAAQIRQDDPGPCVVAPSKRDENSADNDQNYVFNSLDYEDSNTFIKNNNYDVSPVGQRDDNSDSIEDKIIILSYLSNNDDNDSDNNDVAAQLIGGLRRDDIGIVKASVAKIYMRRNVGVTIVSPFELLDPEDENNHSDGDELEPALENDLAVRNIKPTLTKRDRVPK